jgi:hypothetical protein
VLYIFVLKQIIIGGTADLNIKIMSTLTKQAKDKKFLIEELNYVKGLIDEHINDLEDSEEDDFEHYHLIMHALRQTAGKSATILLNEDECGDIAPQLVELNFQQLIRSNAIAIEIIESYS